jgi:ribose transport system substrate-binding protein
MAMGARKAFGEVAEGERAKWMKIPFTGCDGMPKTGQAWVRNGTLAATIFIRQNTDLAIEMLVEAMKNGAHQPEHKLTEPESVPTLADLAASASRNSPDDKLHRGAGV